jgi:hypothetical protein
MALFIRFNKAIALNMSSNVQEFNRSSNWSNYRSDPYPARDFRSKSMIGESLLAIDDEQFQK